MRLLALGIQIVVATSLVACTVQNKSDTTQVTTDSVQTKNEYEGLIAGGKDVSISGEMFSPGELPADLTGAIFYPTQTRKSLLKFVSPTEVQIIAEDVSIPATYTVNNEAQVLQLSYQYQGQEQADEYGVSRSNDKVWIKLNNLEHENKPLPLSLKAQL